MSIRNALAGTSESGVWRFGLFSLESSSSLIAISRVWLWGSGFSAAGGQRLGAYWLAVGSDRISAGWKDSPVALGVDEIESIGLLIGEAINELNVSGHMRVLWLLEKDDRLRNSAKSSDSE
jgi:hypothetical protein